MTLDPSNPAPASLTKDGAAPRRPLPLALLKLARPTQWAKGAFVLIGPAYALTDSQVFSWPAVVATFIAFNLASSGCYVVNDLRDVEQDRVHPRKRRRPIASGEVTPAQARVFAALLFLAAAAAAIAPGIVGIFRVWSWTVWLVPACVGLYALNVTAYSMRLKHVAILDVVSLAAGFVLRVLGGCAAAAAPPSTWLLNCTFFLSMFLAFGKRLGERRTMGVEGQSASSARTVQSIYTDDLLRMVVVMTAVATLVLYAGYIQARDEKYTFGFNLLWLTVLPATYALLRSILLVERGEYDDPTELAVHDRPFQAAMGLYALITVSVIALVRFTGPTIGASDAPPNPRTSESSFAPPPATQSTPGTTP